MTKYRVAARCDDHWFEIEADSVYAEGGCFSFYRKDMYGTEEDHPFAIYSAHHIASVEEI